LKHGELEKEHLDKDLLISIQADIFLSVLKKSLKTQSSNNISMNMLKDQDLAEDLDFDCINIYVSYLFFPLKDYHHNL
jgi:hypothetical protein